MLLVGLGKFTSAPVESSAGEFPGVCVSSLRSSWNEVFQFGSNAPATGFSLIVECNQDSPLSSICTLALATF